MDNSKYPDSLFHEAVMNGPVTHAAHLLAYYRDPLDAFDTDEECARQVLGDEASEAEVTRVAAEARALANTYDDDYPMAENDP